MNSDPVGEVDWVEAGVETTKHLENDDITHVGWDDEGHVYTRCGEHPNQIQKWFSSDDPMFFAKQAVMRFVFETGLDNTVSGFHCAPSAHVEEDDFNNTITWREYTFQFDVDHGNHIKCVGLIIHPKEQGAPSRAQTIETLEGFLGVDVVQYLAYDEWLGG